MQKLKIVDNEYGMVCDINGCDRMAEYRLIMDVGGDEQLCICSECLRDFHREASKKINAEVKKNAKRKEK